METVSKLELAEYSVHCRINFICGLQFLNWQQSNHILAHLPTMLYCFVLCHTDGRFVSELRSYQRRRFNYDHSLCQGTWKVSHVEYMCSLPFPTRLVPPVPPLPLLPTHWNLILSCRAKQLWSTDESMSQNLLPYTSLSTSNDRSLST